MSDKLYGFEFYKSIGSPKYVLAPMVDQSELAWRLLGRKYNAELTFTPMFHAANFVNDRSYRKDAIEISSADRPLIYQFCSNDPEIFTEAAKMVQGLCDAVDLNLGCPQAIAKRGHYGSFLQDEWELIKTMLTKCVKEINIPVTAKIRAQSSIELTVQYAKMIESCGISMITIHGRTREQRGINTGLADWKVIKAVKEAVTIPVIANGNIQYFEDITRCFAETGVDGVMSAEGHLHNPAIFSKGVQKLVWEMALEYLNIVKEHPCPLSYSRGHIFKLLHHALHYHPHIRETVGSARNVEDFISAVEELKKCCGPENCVSDQQLLFNLPHNHWFCQPYIRPHSNATKRPSDETTESLIAVECPEIDRAAVNKYMCTELSDEVKTHRAEAKRRKTEAKKLCKENEEKRGRPELNCPCQACTSNQRGVKCEYGMCRMCCKKKRVAESISCDGHVQWKNGRVKKDLNDQRPHHIATVV